MDNEYMEFSEKTLDDCITAACRKLSVTSENLDYEVMDQGSTGFMGFNSRNAVIKAKIRDNSHGVAAASGDVLDNVHTKEETVVSDLHSSSASSNSSFRSPYGSSSYGIGTSYGSSDDTSDETVYRSETGSDNDLSYDEAKADTSSYNRRYSGSDFTRSSGSGRGSSRDSYGSSRGSSYGKSGRGTQEGSRSHRDRSYGDRSYNNDRSYRNHDRSYGSYGGRSNRGHDHYDYSTSSIDYSAANAAAAAASAAAAQKRAEEPKVNFTDEQIAEFRQKADAFLQSMFQAMEMEVEISYDFDRSENIMTLNFEGADMGVLIGKRGQTLDSIQYLVSLVVNKGVNGYVHVKADTENYRERRRKTLENLARNMAAKVKRTHRAQALEPMNPYERRIIHSALQGDKYVTTYSEGEDPYRKVVIIPKE